MKVALAYSGLALSLANVAVADIYMHHPHGSNNRCDETNNNRQNAQRMFDSENNAAGGYNIPGFWQNTLFDAATQSCVKLDKFIIHSETDLNIAWTSQHGCGAGNDCNIVLQMGYKHPNSLPNLRDGRPEIRGVAFEDDPQRTENGDGSACTETPPMIPFPILADCMVMYNLTGNTPEFAEKCITPYAAINGDNNNVNEQTYIGDENGQEGQMFDVCTYGEHEPYEYYLDCFNTEAHGGLWRATENVQERKGAVATRQNNNGQRHGFECSEERDYYPYWRKSPWVTFAYLTSKPEQCLQKGLDENSPDIDYKKEYCRCWRSDAWVNLPNHDEDYKIPQDPIECVTRETLQNQTMGWIPEWRCGTAAGFETHERALKDFGIQQWDYHCGAVPSSFPNHLGPATMSNGNSVNNNGMEHFYAYYPWRVPTVDKPMEFIVRIRYNISTPDVDGLTSKDNGDDSPIKDDTYHLTSVGPMMRIAINDNQLPRAFEDRSYVWEMQPKITTGTCANKKIHNVNVMGKRGNIAQVRNCVEYFFIPMEITVNQDDCVHFQWTGSDYNSKGNDGEGKAGTDRNNLVQIDHPDTIKPNEGAASNMLGSVAAMERLAAQYQPVADGESCYTPEDCGVVGNAPNPGGICNQNQQNKMNCALLNSAPAYFNMEPMEIEAAPGTYHFANTRNNNFSNRDQKLTVHVTLSTVTVAVIATVSGLAFIAIVGGVVFALYSKGMLQKASYEPVNTDSAQLASSATRI